MARRSSTRVASVQSTPRKRSSQDASSTPARSSKRVKADEVDGTQKATPTKSKYFEHESEDEPESEIENEVSGYEDEDASAVSTPPDSISEADEDDEFSEEDIKPKRRVSQKKGATTAKAQKGQEMWRPDVRTGLGPGKQVIIKLPKPRAPGSTPYRPETIHPNTFLFLKDLAKNNDREWLKMHDVDFRTSERDFDSFAGALTEHIIEKDFTIPELPVKDIKFRIYRDIRFSSDNTPYKPYFSAAWSRTGRKGPYAGYYVQVQPGNRSFIGGGMWMPEPEPLSRLRRDVDRRSYRLKEILMESRLRREYLDGAAKDEKKVVKAFVGQSQENALKTKPKGYSKDNPNIEILRLRNYTLGKRLQDEEVVGRNGINRIADLIGILTPFITYLNNVVMPDGPPSEASSDQESEEGAEGSEELSDESADSPNAE